MIHDDLSDILACSMQNDPVVSKASELLRLGLMPSVEEIKAGKVCIMFFLGDLFVSSFIILFQDLLSIDISSFSSKEKVAS
jgi:hypothetical protein